MGGRPSSKNQLMLRQVDQQLRAVSLTTSLPIRVTETDYEVLKELQAIADQTVYAELQASDQSLGRWTAEDPSLRSVQRWVRTRR